MIVLRTGVSDQNHTPLEVIRHIRLLLAYHSQSTYQTLLKSRKGFAPYGQIYRQNSEL